MRQGALEGEVNAALSGRMATEREWGREKEGAKRRRERVGKRERGWRPGWWAEARESAPASLLAPP